MERLSALKDGCKAYVVSVDAPNIQKIRLNDLGFLKGESVERLYASPLGSPVVYRVMGREVALRRSEARYVVVSTEKTVCAADECEEKLDAIPSADLPELENCHTACCHCADATCPSCSRRSKKSDRQMAEDGKTLAIVGNPNCGKTAFFNAASGGHERTGNYAGVTVTSTVGHLTMDGKNVTVVDLPGTYSLHASSPDEAFVMHELVKGHVDVIVNVIDVGNLERNLLLTMQLLRMPKPVVCVLNMYDEFRQSGSSLDVAVLQERLGVPCVQTVARNGEGVADAIRKALSLVDTDASAHIAGRLQVGAGVESRHRAVKDVLEGIYTLQPREMNLRTSIIDRLTARGPLAYVLFAMVMVAVFWLTFQLGGYPMEWIENGVTWLGESLATYLPEGMFRDMVVDGVIGGVGSVIVFLPNILILYLCISLLEDSGYLARAAMLADPLFERLGLHGKSFIPMLMGFGCNVPAVMATRTISNRKTRLITMLAVPFMSCSARLPVYVVFCGAFFPEHAVWVMTLLYFGGIAVALFLSWVMGRVYQRSRTENFVMEVPPYRVPQPSSVVRHTWEKGRQYLRKMGSVILVASIVIWTLGYFPRGGEDLTPAQQQEQSWLGSIGHAMEPVFAPLGFDWRMDVGILAGTGAKELMVSTMGILYDCAEEDADAGSADEASGTRLAQTLSRTYTPATALAYMVFALFYFPCIATVVAIGAESGRRRVAYFAAVYTTLVAYLMAWVVQLLA